MFFLNFFFYARVLLYFLVSLTYCVRTGHVTKNFSSTRKLEAIACEEL